MNKIRVFRNISLLTLVIVLFSFGPVSQAVHSQESACITPPAGLVSWWPGDGNALDIWNGNHGTLMNGATFGPALVDRAFSLDGIDDYVDLGIGNNLNFPTNDFTVDLWVNFRTTYGEQVMIEKYIENSAQFGRPGWTLTKLDGNIIRVHLADTLESTWNALDVTPSSIPTNTWIHAAFTRSGDTFTIYWNGVALGSATFPGVNLDTWASLKLGHRGNPNDPWPSNSTGSWDTRNFYLNGLIDEVEIYNRALSTEEIAAIYAAGSAGKCKVTTIEIDIKPGSDPNSINLKSKGNVPVAILSSPTFDATTVDRGTVIFAGASPLPIGKSPEDVNGDGLPDVVLHFKTQELNLQPGDTEACLSGKTLVGQDIEGCDSVRIVK